MAKSRLALRSALCAILAMLVATLWSQPAIAYSFADRVTVYSGSGLCVQGTAGIDHRVPGSFSGNQAWAETYARSQGCGTGLINRYAAVRLDVYRWNGSGWAVCRGTDWKYGYTGISGGDVGGPYGPSQGLDWGGSSSCGAGYYGTLAQAWVWDGSAWRGGSVWSGYEYVP